MGRPRSLAQGAPDDVGVSTDLLSPRACTSSSYTAAALGVRTVSGRGVLSVLAFSIQVTAAGTEKDTGVVNVTVCYTWCASRSSSSPRVDACALIGYRGGLRRSVFCLAFGACFLTVCA